MFIAGIDYSITSPGLCIMSLQDPGFANSMFYLYNDKPKLCIELEKKFPNIKYTGPDKNYFNNMQRFWNITEFVLNTLKFYEIEKIFIEGYAMAGKGLVFNIGENTGILKYWLWKLGYDYDIVPPTQIKKFATSKGNANKIAMNNAFTTLTGVELCDINKIGTSPYSDLIDSYFIARYGREQILNKNNK